MRRLTNWLRYMGEDATQLEQHRLAFLIAFALFLTMLGAAELASVLFPDPGPCFDPGARCVRLAQENQP